MVETAKSKVKLVTRASGLANAHGTDSSLGPPGVDLSSAEAAISKQVAMAEQVTKRAEAAVNRLSNHKSGAQQQHHGNRNNLASQQNAKKRPHAQQGGRGGKGGGKANKWQKGGKGWRY